MIKRIHKWDQRDHSFLLMYVDSSPSLECGLDSVIFFYFKGQSTERENSYCTLEQSGRPPLNQVHTVNITGSKLC